MSMNFGSIIRGCGRLTSRVRNELLSEPMLYVRPGEPPKEIYATPEEQSLMGPHFAGFEMSTDSQVFVFQKSFFTDADGNFCKPKKDDEIIKKINGVTMRHIVAPAGKGPCWEWNGIAENEIAIHAERFRE